MMQLLHENALLSHAVSRICFLPRSVPAVFFFSKPIFLAYLVFLLCLPITELFPSCLKSTETLQETSKQPECVFMNRSERASCAGGSVNPGNVKCKQRQHQTLSFPTEKRNSSERRGAFVQITCHVWGRVFRVALSSVRRQEPFWFVTDDEFMELKSLLVEIAIHLVSNTSLHWKCILN